jgi:hypothetical protein
MTGGQSNLSLDGQDSTDSGTDGVVGKKLSSDRKPIKILFLWFFSRLLRYSRTGFLLLTANFPFTNY